MAWLTQSEKDKIVNLYKIGHSTHKIAAMVNKGVTTVKRVVSRQGLKKNDYVDHDLDAKIAKLYTDGLSVPALCRATGLKSRRVINGIKRSGLAIRTISQQCAIHNPSRGRKHTAESKMKQSKAALERYADKEKVEGFRSIRERVLHPELGITERAWFKSLLLKVDFTCQITGQRGIKLAVHHLHNVRDFPELRWDELNVIVVSHDLHTQFHYKYMGNARKPCTRIDWENFIREWVCVECGSLHLRDVNAAKNILSFSVQDIARC